MQPILFRIPITTEGIPVYGFGLMLFLTFLATTWLASHRARKMGIAPEVIQDVAVWIFLGGLIGARLTYLVFHERLHNPLQVLAALPRIWDGGIILYGAVAGALIGYLIGHALFFRKKPNVTVLRMADLIAPTVALGLILGRMGCFLNGCCYGQVACPSCPAVSFPLSSPAMGQMVQRGYQTAAGFLLRKGEKGEAVVRLVDPGSAAAASGLKASDVITRMKLGTTKGKEEPVKDRQDIYLLLGDPSIPRDQKTEITLTVQRDDKEITLPPFRPRTIGLHPTQIYESISMVLLLFLLLSFEPFKTRDGQVMALMMICYGAHRYVNEILRSDERPAEFEKIVSGLVIAGGFFLLGWLWWRNAPAQTPAPLTTPTARPETVKASAGTSAAR
jgi:phosphatidylglycerol---prolipoprotein diacylglyceryl transferase